MQRIILTLFTLVAASAATAQTTALTLAEKLQLGTVMTMADFKAMTNGNTITYSDGITDLYREYYRPDTNRIVIEWTEARDPSQQLCDIGTWYVQEELICFDWQASGAVCALWVDYQGEYISAIAGPDGLMSENLEVISEITEKPLYCEVGLVELTLPPLFPSAG